MQAGAGMLVKVVHVQQHGSIESRRNMVLSDTLELFQSRCSLQLISKLLVPLPKGVLNVVINFSLVAGAFGEEGRFKSRCDD